MGWGVNLHERYEVRNAFGRWVVIARMPRVGEFYAVFGSADRFVSNGKLDLARYAKHLEESDYSDWSQGIENDDALAFVKQDTRSCYCTLEFHKNP